MARSSWKTPFVDPSLLAAMENQSSAGSMKNKKAVLKTQSRQSMILPSFVGKTFQVYTGKTFIQVHVREEMVGHRLGEYANTRKPGTHPTKGKKKK
jgi:small subunit ribosomal protein S19